MELLILIIAIAINTAISFKFSSIATDKGYNGTNYFWLCFFLGAVGYCMVAALPDQILHDRIEKLAETLRNPSPQPKRSRDLLNHPNPPSANEWACTCGRVNAGYVSSCVCGMSKRDAMK